MSRYEEIREQIYDTPHGPAEVALYEELIREADQSGDLERQYSARDGMVESAVFSGQEAKAMVAFAWCLAQSDRDPQRFPPGSLLWKYKWIVNNAFNIPTIGREQIEGLFRDVKRRFQESSVSLRPILNYEAQWEAHRGNLDLAADLADQANRLPRDSQADCRACEHSSEILHRIHLRQYDRAVELADQSVAKRMSCGEEPQRQMSYASVAYQAAGREEDSRQCFETWYPKVRRNPNFLFSTVCHLSCLVRRGQLPEALKLFERHLPWTAQVSSQAHIYRFFLTSHHLFAALEAAGKAEVKLRAAGELIPVADEAGKVSTAAVKDWAYGEAARIGKAFDARNGTGFFASQLQSPWPWGI